MPFGGKIRIRGREKRENVKDNGKKAEDHRKKKS
jgi:hypothetical protein